MGKIKNIASNTSEIEYGIASLLPDAKLRERCLSVFAESLTEANFYGGQKWGVYYGEDADRLRLLVGSLIVLTIQKQGVWMALDRQRFSESADASEVLNRSPDWHWDTGQWSEYKRIPSKNGYYIPSDNHPQIWPFIRRFHFAYIAKIANKFSQLQKKSQHKHMPHVLTYLRQTLNRHIPEPVYNEPYDAIFNPLRDIQNYQATCRNQHMPETERESVIQSRIGQERFRTDLIRYWKGCAVTACQTLEILRASHIKPWRISDHNERLDVYNGLLLVPNLDAAFDSGFISFTDDGIIMISDFLTGDEQDKLGIHRKMRLIKVEGQHSKHLNYHRKYVFKS